MLADFAKNKNMENFQIFDKKPLACIAIVSTRVCRQRLDESKKKGMTGEGKGKEGNACP